MSLFLPILRLTLITVTLSACQLFSTNHSALQQPLRLQGTLTQFDQQWSLQPCDAPEPYTLIVSAALNEELNTLISEAPNGLFADLSGELDPNLGHFTVAERYRLQIEGHDCSDTDFARLLLRASGNEPFWSILQTPKGLILNQAGEPALALPYIEEQLPDGRFQISTQADQQNLQLWVTPQQCIDSMSGTVYHLSARLQLNQQTFQGCAAFGALRN